MEHVNITIAFNGWWETRLVFSFQSVRGMNVCGMNGWINEIYILNCDDSVEWLGQPSMRSLFFTYLQYVPLFMQTIYKWLNLNDRTI